MPTWFVTALPTLGGLLRVAYVVIGTIVGLVAANPLRKVLG